MYSVGVIIPSWKYWAQPMKLQPLWELYYATLIKERCSGTAVDVVDLRHPATQLPDFTIGERDIYFYWIMKSADAPEIYKLENSVKAL